MSADEEYLDDVFDSLKEGEEEPGSLPLEEGAEEDDFSLDDFTLEESAFDDLDIADFPSDEAAAENSDADGNKGSISPDEVDAMFAAADAAAAETDTPAKEESQDDDIFNFFGDMPEEEEESESGKAESSADGMPESTEAEGDQEQGKKKKKVKKKKRFLFGKKKNQEAEGVGDGTEADDAGTEEKVSEGEENVKPQGFFSKIIAFLTETDDDTEENSMEGLEPSDENKSILKELEDEDKKKKKKKVKEKKGGEENPKEKKKKKEKKEKKESKEETEPQETVAKGKKISIKSIALIIGFSLTFTAVIMVVCNVIPGFFEKRAARNAFYDADYAKSYELLYGKKRDESDEMIYNKSKTILEMRRKLDSYHNYLGIGKEVQALDALMSGVEKYPEILAKAEEYRVVQDVNAIYESILSILRDKYGLDESLAQTVIGYDDVTYTKKLESVVYGTPFDVSPERNTAPEAAADILPEERALTEEESTAESQENSAENTPDVSEQEESVQEELPAGIDENVSQDNTSQQEQAGEQIPFQEPETIQPDGSSSSGEDVSAWDGSGSYGSQGEQIQGIRQPIGIEIHGN